MKSKAEHTYFLLERFLYVFLWYNLEIQHCRKGQLQDEELWQLQGVKLWKNQKCGFLSETWWNLY